jgi:ketosteroid isomerase-like protein
VTRGWQGLHDRYRRTYPDRAAMGRVSFSDLEIRLLGCDAALVLGRWRLDRERDTPGGVFTLVLRKFPEGWRIIHDHTSSDQ